ncbi:hypothetical protein GE061_008470 [Apolygus lucorum]|uniref:Elongation of very long chain fatty acids protein n=1 Tax=Apolygus lucorum TaxID=248454 RepID=A0A6A4IYD5_APOLU|nr:hypothetical protein GE061_008470 [Apolygus lucorum]
MIFGIIRSVIEKHDYVMDTYGDPRVKDWFLMSGPLPSLCICLTYVFIVKYLGPKLMENRKPFELNKLMIVYNALSVAFSCSIVYEAAICGWMTTYSFSCQPVDYSNDPLAVRMAEASWYYFFSKFIEFFDTFFFVLRKKNNQISTLHVIHHAIMPFSVWWGVKFVPGGHPTFFGWLNSMVHAIMYSYYLLAALGPKVQKYLWWKKYLTKLQIIQFVLIGIHSGQLFFIECEVPVAFAWVIAAHAVLFYVLFNRFYEETYSTDKSKTKGTVAMNVCMPNLHADDSNMQGRRTGTSEDITTSKLIGADKLRQRAKGEV